MLMRSAARLLVTALACVFALQWANEAHAHGVTLKIHHFLPADSAFHTRFLLPWKEKLEKESDGHLRIQVYPAMQLGGDPAQLYEQARDRSVDIVWTELPYDAGRFPAFEVFNLPWTINHAKGSSRALWQYVQKHNLARKEFAGVRLLAVQVSPAGSGEKERALPADDANPPPFHSNVFVLAMNADAYKSLPDELKTVIGANSGAETSAWLGKVFDDSQARAAPSTGDAPAAEPAVWQRRAQDIVDNRIKELDRRGLDGRELVDSARALLEEFDPPN